MINIFQSLKLKLTNWISDTKCNSPLTNFEKRLIQNGIEDNDAGRIITRSKMLAEIRQYQKSRK